MRPGSDVHAAPLLILALVLWSSLALNLHNLDHTGLTQFDEGYHAVVAQNLLRHPLRPTLIDVPYIPYDHRSWTSNHVWLHKPVLPLWQIALSFLLLGVDAFALRLPAALLSTAAAGLTYLIGTQLFDRRTALVAATLQAANPFLTKLIHGYQFADSIDISLLFWVEVGIYFLVRSLRTGAWRDVLLAGVAQGLAFLSKSYLAAIVFGVALTAWLLPVCRLDKRAECRIGPLRLLGLLGATFATVAPWLVFCMTQYTDEFWHEHAAVLQHLHGDVERWGAPWDRVVFDYLIAIYGVFYTPILVAAIVLAGRAVAERHAGLWLSYAWGLGVIVPHLVAATKTPSATVIAIPALMLLLGQLVALASRGQRWPLAALTGVLAMSLIVPTAAFPNPGRGYASPHAFGAVMCQELWVFAHIGGALAFVAVVALAWLLTRRRWSARPSRILHVTAFTLCLGVLSWMMIQSVRAAWRVTCVDHNDPHSVAVGGFVRHHLAHNAVLLCDEPPHGRDHMTTMFYADRVCYRLRGRDAGSIAPRVMDAGGIPCVVSYRRLPLSVIQANDRGGPTIYLWQPQQRPQ